MRRKKSGSSLFSGRLGIETSRNSGIALDTLVSSSLFSERLGIETADWHQPLGVSVR